MNPPPPVAFSHFAADTGGGSDRSLFDLVTRLPRDRIAPFMVLRTGDPLADAYRTAGIPVETLPLVPPRNAPDPAALSRYALSFWPAVIRMARLFRRHGARAVHVNTLHNLQGPFAARLAGLPLVWHIRELGTSSAAARLMLRLVPLLAHRAVAISPAVLDTLASCGPRARLVRNGIDLSEYEDLSPDPAVRSALGADRGEVLVTAVGRLEPWKGQHVLVEAIPALLAACPAARIAFVGAPATNKPGYLPRLQERCAELGVADRVVFAGRRTDIPAVMASSDVIVLPTATAEPFGRTVVEAMAAGRPVVATCLGGPADILRDGETGLLVPPDNPAAIAGAVAGLLGDSARRDRMGAAARQDAVQRFSMERVVGEMTRLIEEVLTGSEARGTTASPG